jgi:UDP-N-acetylmuramate: L-alanyl-gamma-D-glutamyl-meso-diaminopimelate ligase
LPLEIFGKHNLQNLAGAKWICQHMGIDEDDFYEAIESFSGASKRLEKIAENTATVIFKDFAHSPSKVAATTKAVKAQYKNRTVLACLELHTYSSLNAAFLEEYKGALDAADKAVVFYSPHAVKIKQLEEVTAAQIASAFERDDLIIYTNPQEFKDFLFNQNLENTALLLMSSGDYGGLNFEELKTMI